MIVANIKLDIDNNKLCYIISNDLYHIINIDDFGYIYRFYQNLKYNIYKFFLNSYIGFAIYNKIEMLVYNTDSKNLVYNI